MDKEISLDKVPQKIIGRFIENCNYLMKSLLSFNLVKDDDIVNKELDIYGFRNLLVGLSN